MKKKIMVLISILVLNLFLITNFSSATILKDKDNNSIECWAVIITTFGSSHSLYDSLINTSNWDEKNIKLLNNKTSTRQAILDALEWLKENSDENDFVVFADYSHGVGTRKEGGKYGIVPIDFEESGCILIQSIDEKLDEIKSKGMCLIFDCCFSGSFVNKRHSLWINIIDRDWRFKTGLEGKNRVVLMSTMKNGLGFSQSTTSSDGSKENISFLAYIAEAISNKIDYNNDGNCSAEEAFYYAKERFLPTAKTFMFNLIFQLNTFRNTNFFIKAFPTICDNYRNELPLAQI